MFKHILIATDGSELAQKAVLQGLTFARAVNADVTAVTVSEPWDALTMAALAQRQLANPVADYQERVAAEANRILWSVGQMAKMHDVPCATLYVKDKHPAEGIVETAQERGCDLIVMATHGRRGIARLVLGSQASKVLALSPVPVLVVR
jgi:nucleotide-binding universal stress UspA family protein